MLQYGNKGFVLTLDALIAVVLLFVIISPLFAENSKTETIRNIYLSNKGGDIAAVLDYSGIADTLNGTMIQTAVNSSLVSEGMEMNITSYYVNSSNKSVIDFNLRGSPKNFAAAGKRFFFAANSSGNRFGVIQYRVWEQ